MTWLQRKNPSVVWRFRTASKVAALSIDDAPHGDGSSTEAILDALQAHDVRATFFIISGQVVSDKHRALLRRMVAEGHELGNHMTEDSKSVLLDDGQYWTQLRECDRLLREFTAGGEAVRWHRPGGGFFSKRTLRLASAMGYQTVLGGVYPHDPQISSSALNGWYLRARTSPGSIVVIHDREHTPATLRAALPSLRKRLRLVSISGLQAETAPPTAAEGRQLRPATPRAGVSFLL